MYEKSMKTMISITIAAFIAMFIIGLMILIRYFQIPKDGDSSSSAESAVVTTTTAASQTESSQPDTTTTAETTTTTTTAAAKEYVTYSFRTKKQFEGHFEKHGKEFGDITKEQYLQKANDLINNDSDTILHKTETEDGDYIFYDTVNNEILFLSTDGYIRTYFKPNKGIEYYNKQ